MNSSDPDPQRTSGAAKAPGITVTWSPSAAQEYSRLTVPKPARSVLNTLARQAARETLRRAPMLFSLPSNALGERLLLDFSFVSNAEMQSLNSAHRGKDQPTDVLSFSQLEGEAVPGGGEEVLLGDIIVSIATAAQQAQQLQHSLHHEIAFLTTHGVLHLCGYDHDTSARWRVMRKWQDEIAAALGFEESSREAATAES